MKNTILLFVSLGFIVIWVDQFIYNGVSFKDSYFFLMFAMGGFLYYLYSRGQAIIKKNDEQLKEKKK